MGKDPDEDDPISNRRKKKAEVVISTKSCYQDMQKEQIGAQWANSLQGSKPAVHTHGLTTYAGSAVDAIGQKTPKRNNLIVQ
eukprot:3215204-Amphidinium_carterae.2